MSISPRERELLGMLEVIRRNRERITIADFARRAGYRHKSGLQRFATLRAALHDYCVVQRGRKHLESPRADVAARTARERESVAQTQEIGRLRRRLDEALARIAQREESLERLAAVERDRDALRGIVTALISQIAQTSVKRAVEIERDILAVAAQYVEGVPEEAPSVVPTAAGNKRNRLRVT